MASRFVPGSPTEERLAELLAMRAAWRLSEEEESELAVLERKAPDFDLDAYDRAAAALDLDFARDGRATMPRALRDRILASAPTSKPVQSTATRRSPFALAGWVLAAAASLVAWFGWNAGARAPLSVSTSQALAAFRAEARDAVSIEWKPTEDPDGKNVGGVITWSPSLQKGFMTFRGLPRNDPARRQYQLWIFDKKRSDATPVDGGIFDVDADSGEIVVPIDAKIPVREAGMFAVTVEEPGGVVVSKRERIVSLAQL